jgi:hypothetical protein
LLARLQGCHFFAGRPFEVHPKPQHGDHYPCHPSGDVLSDLGALFACKFANLDVVRFYFGRDHRTGRRSVRWLNGCDWLWVAARTAGEHDRSKGRKHTSAHDTYPLRATQTRAIVDGAEREAAHSSDYHHRWIELSEEGENKQTDYADDDPMLFHVIALRTVLILVV